MHSEKLGYPFADLPGSFTVVSDEEAWEMRAQKRDAAEPVIVAALERIGALVYRLHQPADLLVWFRNRWHLLEVKDPGRKKLRADQAGQTMFLELTGTPVVRSAEQALRALGAIR